MGPSVPILGLALICGVHTWFSHLKKLEDSAPESSPSTGVLLGSSCLRTSTVLGVIGVLLCILEENFIAHSPWYYITSFTCSAAS
jgi:hypothetical protein